MDTIKTIWLTIIYEYCSPSNIGSALDLVILAVAIVIVGAAFFYCIKYFIHPGEEEEDHIKRSVLEDGRLVDTRVSND